MNIIRKCLIINCKFWKLNSSTPYKDEFTVFIKVSIETLKEFSKEIPKNVKKEDNMNKEIIKIKTDKKYLFIIILSKLISEKGSLLTETFLGLTCEIKFCKENLNNIYNFKNLIPELVEKKDPPIMTKIKKIKVKWLVVLFKEYPVLEILLINEKKVAENSP